MNFRTPAAHLAVLMVFSCAALSAQDPDVEPRPEPAVRESDSRDQPPLEFSLRETVVVEPDSFPARPLSDDVVITPSRRATPANENATAITVITGEQIRQRRQSSVLEVLRDVPGLDVVQAGGPGRQASVFRFNSVT